MPAELAEVNKSGEPPPRKKPNDIKT